MTPVAARDKILGVKMQNLRVIPAQEFPKVQKRGSHEWAQETARNPKLRVIFEKYAPMSSCPPLARPQMTK